MAQENPVHLKSYSEGSVHIKPQAQERTVSYFESPALDFSEPLEEDKNEE